jgi:hypothetical protein
MSLADVLPLWLLYTDPKIPGLLTATVNDSLINGKFSNLLKTSIITPIVILEKSDLDPEKLKNYCPISNLCLLSKVLESTVAEQLTEHLESISYHHPHQSAYHCHYSMETPLLKVTSDWQCFLAEGLMVCPVSLIIRGIQHYLSPLSIAEIV